MEMWLCIFAEYEKLSGKSNIVMNVKQNQKYIVEGQLGTQMGLFFYTNKSHESLKSRCKSMTWKDILFTHTQYRWHPTHVQNKNRSGIFA